MYDALSANYDRFVNWEARLQVEMLFLMRQLKGLGNPPRVLDAACGTGMHVLALARQGVSAAGADLSVPMIEHARRNAAAAGLQAAVRFEAAGFGTLAQAFAVSSGGAFDALLCLGNSLPHALSQPELEAALSDFADCLRPGGLLIVQNRNFDAVLEKRERWMEPQSFREGNREWIFIRFYDYESDGSIRFNLLTLEREGQGGWQQQVGSTRLAAWRRGELEAALNRCGFAAPDCYGSLSGDPFDAHTSGNLVLAARRL